MRKTKRIVWLAAAALAAVLAAVAGCKHDDEDDWTPVTIRGTMLEKYAGQRTDVTIPDGVTGIGSRAFSDSDVTAVVIPSGVTSIDANAFEDSKVTSVSYLGTLAQWNELVGGGLPDNIKVSCFIIEDGILIRYEGDEIDVVIPAGFVKGIADKDIGDGVFSGRDITVVTIPGSVRRVGTHAFAGCTTLKDVRIEAGVADIGAFAFTGCTGLESATIPAGARRLGGGIFNGCTGLTGLSVHESVTEIAPGALAGTERLEAITYTGRKAQWEKLVVGKERDFAGKRVYCQDGEDWWYGPERDTGDDPSHTHDFKYDFLDKDTHKKGCKLCDYAETEAHEYDDSDTECNKCGYVRENSGDPDCKHKLVPDYNADGHFQKCTECDYRVGFEVHNWSGYTYDNGTHSRSCTAEGCGYSEPVPHEWSTTYTTDADKHCKTCTISGCTAHDEEGAHDYNGAPYQDDGNGKHYQNCKVCKHQSDSVDHNYANAPYIDDKNGGHYQTCTANGCNARTAPPTPHNFKYEEIDDDTHRVTCEVCDYSIAEEHEYGDDTDANCNKCEYTRVVKPLPLPLPIEGGTLTIDAEGKVTEYKPASQTTEIGVTIPNGVTGIDENVFAGHHELTGVSIPGSVDTIGGGAFQNCSKLEHLEISDGVKNIEHGAFEGCHALTAVTIPGSVETIGQGAFQNCTGLQEVTIEKGVKEIGANAFQNCSNLTKVTIPDSVESIGDNAFSGCPGLTDITIPASVTNIGDNALACSNLETITFTGTIAQWLERSENSGVGDNVTVKCSNGTVPYDMQGTTLQHYWGRETAVEIPWNSVETIGNGAFATTGVTSVKITEGVKHIGDGAFQGCGSLTKVEIPMSMESIGYHAFFVCDNLKSITYAGTADAWLELTKDVDLGIGNDVTVTCSDGKTITCTVSD